MKNMSELGKLKKVNIRDVWPHEAIDFTNWLAKEENLELLGNEVGFDMKLIKTEADVGSFSADILAEEEGSGNKIIIENQFGKTNHDHLGKIITYASGYDAKIIIWITEEAREEHRKAIDWLNDNTNDNTGFYLLKIELWQIGESNPAPKFDIVAKPNDWARTVDNYVGDTELTETKIKQREFWEAFKDYAKQNNTNLKFQKSHPQNWTTISVGSSLCNLALTINTKEKKFGCELYIPNNKELYYKFYNNKNKIENELAEKLEWMELPNKFASRARTMVPGNFEDENTWEDVFEWMQEKAEKFKEVFPKYFYID